MADGIAGADRMSLKFDPDASIARVRRLGWGAAAAFTVGALFWGWSHVLGALSGGLAAMGGFEALVRLVGRLTAERPRAISLMGVVGVVFRYILLCIVLFVIIGVWRANVVALAIGISAPVAAVFVECGLYTYQELKSEREPRQ